MGFNAKRFWAKVEVLTPESCWEWQACVNESGYGIFGIGNKRVDRAHRISYRLKYGNIPDDLFVCHSCDNPKCVNPNHLFLGTNQDNVNDMLAKGRNSLPPNMAGWNKKQYSPEIITLLGKKPDTEIAALAGVSKYAIQHERKRRGITAFPSQTRFRKGASHPRWSREREVNHGST